jgi:two-component system sensor histidine kinase KdpD
VTSPASEYLPDAAKDSIAESLRLAESLGADISTINAESNVADEILAFARSRNVSRIVIGRPRPRRVTAWFTRETVAEEIIRKAEDFEVTIVSADPGEARKAAIRGAVLVPERDPKAYLWSAAAVAAATAVAIFVNRIFPVESLSLFFLVAVLGAAARFGLWPSIFASGLAFLSYNFFLTEPFFTFEIANQDLVLTLFLFLLVAIVTGNLAARLRTQALAQRAIARRTANLFDFSRKVASVASLDDVVWAAVTHVASTMQCSSMILMPDSSGQLAIVGGMPPEDHLEPRDRGAAEWAWDKREPAGWSSQTLPSATWLFLPMKSADRIQGVLGVQFGARQYITMEERRLLDSLVDQVGLAIERTKLASDMEQTRLLAETESLRAALLSSVSHDLRTPLVSIIGAATSLVEADEALGASGRRSMAETIRDEGERLNRYVQNLLDMTRLGYGALKVARQPVDLREVVGRALRRLGRDLAAHRVVRDLPASLPEVSGDAVLLEQVVTNILDNAAKYAPPASQVTLSAEPTGGAVALTIEDEGPGIPENDRAQVFDMFFRVRAGDGQPGGTGLGLAIAKGIVDAHGGSIRAEAAKKDGGGTRIVVTLPLAAPSGVPT